ncbi:MAG: ABC transporter ATP-binding protein/permease [Sphingobacteriales bacterium]|nr:ABC transporter ATP-binding protein/permease [Sphingobacteriales bacterium]
MKELFSLNKYLYKYRYRMLLGVVFITLSNWFGVFPAQVIRLAFDLVKEQISLYNYLHHFDRQALFYQGFISVVLLFGFIVFIVAIIKGVFMFFMRQTIIVVSRLIEYDMKNEIYHHYQFLNLSFYRKNNTGDLMNRVSEDVGRVRMYIGPAIMYTLNLIVLFILVISTMISVNPKLTFYAVLPMPFLFVSIYFVQNLINTKSEQIQAQLSTLSNTIQESFSGIRVIKAYVRENEIKDKFNEESEEYRRKTMGLVNVQAVFFPTVLTLIGISTLLTIYVGGKEVIAGNITAGNIAEFIVYVNMLTWPVTSVGWVTSLVQRASASQKRINEYLHTEPSIINDNTIDEIALSGHIKFENVSFTYPETGIKALDNVSFEIGIGKTLAITGRTGSGKSSIANLLFRMYDVDQGRISIDNVDVKKLPLYHYRNQMALVPQEVFLFSDTIRNNIAFGIDHFTEEQIVQAAQNAVVYDNIIQFDKGFDTLVGERGITLSGGQKQRISIARAILKEPKILVFDDALSAVDTKTEEAILKQLKSIMKNRTSIIISHRVSTVKHADLIVYMENGKIIEKGTHDELVALKKSYAELYQKQLLEEESVEM